MRKLLYILIVLCATSCGDDFLFQPPRAALTVGSFPATSNDAVLAVNGAYNILRAWQINTGGFPLLDFMADDVVKGSSPGDGTAVAPYDNFTHTAEEGGLERWYKTEYEAIRRTNLVINEVPNIDMDEDLKSRLIAEARFLRAYFYADLVRGFGAVPMVTEINAPVDLERTPVETILEEIIYPDLENAIANLPERSGYGPEDLGRATKGAARGLLARVKLFYGAFNEVEQLTKAIIDSDEYQLMDDYSDIFTAENEHNVESIFEVGAIPETFANGGSQFANTLGVRGSPNRGWGFGRPAYRWIAEMEVNEDPRLEPSVIFLNEELDGVVISGDGATPDTIYDGSEIIEIEAYNQKVWYPGTDTRTAFGHNKRILRYSDVLLMHAEALNENGKSTEALGFLNQVRNRAGVPEYTTTSQSELRDLIMDERKYELALEGLRFWDLVRTDRAEAVLGPLGFIKGKNELLPIPQSEIDISQGRIDQNPGY